MNKILAIAAALYLVSVSNVNAHKHHFVTLKDAKEWGLSVDSEEDKDTEQVLFTVQIPVVSPQKAVGSLKSVAFAVHEKAYDGEIVTPPIRTTVTPAKEESGVSYFLVEASKDQIPKLALTCHYSGNTFVWVLLKDFIPKGRKPDKNDK